MSDLLFRTKSRPRRPANRALDGLLVCVAAFLTLYGMVALVDDILILRASQEVSQPDRIKSKYELMGNPCITQPQLKRCAP